MTNLKWPYLQCIAKLLEEFNLALNGDHPEQLLKTDAVVVLSAPPSLEFEDERQREANPENVARIKFGIELVKAIGQRYPFTGRRDMDLYSHSLDEPYVPPLVLDGETEQLPMMQLVAQELEPGMPEEKIILVDAGKRGQANTLTQFRALMQSPRFADAKHLVIATSSYHVPRVRRTAKPFFLMEYIVCGVPFREFGFNVEKLVGGEIRRIIEYSQKGDIPLTLS